MRGVLLAIVGAITLTAAVLGPAQNPPSTQNSEAGGTASYLGLTVRDILFPNVPDTALAKLPQLVPIKPGTPLDREQIRQSIQVLYATGRFADIRVEAERVAGGQVSVLFLTEPNYFIGDITVEGTPNRPTPNQVVNASKLQLGDAFSADKLEKAKQGISQVMQENGFYKSTLKVDEQRDPPTQQIALRFTIVPGTQARVGKVTVTGNPGYSQGQVQDIAHLRPGDTVSGQRVSNGLDRLRKKYQKQKQLVAQVAVSGRTYHPESNTVDYTLDISPGPQVAIVAEGFKISRRVLKENVPVYEENALDDDLLNEGRRNLLNYLQSRGYFDATVGMKKHEYPGQNELRIFYVIDPGHQHKLVKVQVEGNKYFASDLLMSQMQIQRAARILSHGRYSQSLLNSDVRGLENLYRANGFQQVKIIGNVADNYQGVKNRLAVTIHVDEGPQTRVAELKIVGNDKINQSEYPELNILAGQPFSESNVASDRDIILNYYYNHGFPNATFEASAQPAPEPNRMDVTYKIREGEQVFVDRVLVSGLHFTKPFVVQREIQVKSGNPLSQIAMLKTQQNLYGLGIFNQVDTAVQNPDGVEPEKNVLVNMQEAKRYTFNYGVGFEFQTGQPAVGTNQPQGETGVSPRVSLEITRLNFLGRDHTITFKSHVGRLQQRGLISYDAPAFFNSKNWRLSLTTFYDNTLDVTTFTSQRLEGSLQATQTISKASTMIYRFTYREVKASNIEISSNLIPLLSLPTRVGGPGFSYIRDKRDNPLETTRGNYFTVDSSVASGYFGSEADFSRVLLQNSTYYAFGRNKTPGKRYVFARSTRIGIETPFGSTIIPQPGQTIAPGFSIIPLPERFFSGGGNSHRGFALNQAGPRDPVTGFPLGGAALFLNNVELRFPPPSLPFFHDNLSFAVFEDAGNVFDTGHDMLHNLWRVTQKNQQFCKQQSTANLCNYNYLSHAIGVGLRYRTPIGPVRFDFGYNLNPPYFPSTQTITDPMTNMTSTVFVPQRVTHFNVFFSIGQTF